MVYTANWGIICYLPPFRGTRNNHWHINICDMCSANTSWVGEVWISSASNRYDANVDVDIELFQHKTCNKSPGIGSFLLKNGMKLFPKNLEVQPFNISLSQGLEIPLKNGLRFHPHAALLSLWLDKASTRGLVVWRDSETTQWESPQEGILLIGSMGRLYGIFTY